MIVWGESPTQKGFVMNLLSVSERTKSIEKIAISNMKQAFFEICNTLLALKLLLFYELGPVLNMVNYNIRITEDVAVTVIRFLLKDSDSIKIPDSLLKDAIERLRYLPQLQIDLEQGFKDGQLFVNVGNGIYDILHKQLIHSREGVNFDYICGFNYIPGAKISDAPHFKHFVETSVGIDNYNCLMRILGYCISSLTKGRKAFLLLGKGRTGKSTLLNLLESIFDADLISHQPFHIMGSEKSRWHYNGKRINISRDNSNRPMKDEEGFKSLISCEETVGREVYQRYIHYTPTLKFIFASNWPLCFAHPDDAVIDRLLVIRFTREIPEEHLDPELEDKLKSEKDIIFSLALDTLKDLIESKYDFCMSDDSKEYIRHQRLQIHSTQDFLADETVLDENGSVSSEKLFAAYNEYCRINAITSLGRNTFLEQVRNYTTAVSYTKVYSNGKRVNGFNGIRFIKSREREVQNDN